MRLIDADALIIDLMDRGLEGIQTDDWAEIQQTVMEQATIEPEPKWTPVSERLPEEDDYKSCIECLDGAVWYFTKNGTMGFGYYYKSTKEWSTTGDLKTDGKVVAWMPLPEPYREDGREK